MMKVEGTRNTCFYLKYVFEKSFSFVSQESSPESWSGNGLGGQLYCPSFTMVLLDKRRGVWFEYKYGRQPANVCPLSDAVESCPRMHVAKDSYQVVI